MHSQSLAAGLAHPAQDGGQSQPLVRLCPPPLPLTPGASSSSTFQSSQPPQMFASTQGLTPPLSQRLKSCLHTWAVPALRQPHLLASSSRDSPYRACTGSGEDRGHHLQTRHGLAMLAYASLDTLKSIPSTLSTFVQIFPSSPAGVSYAFLECSHMRFYIWLCLVYTKGL